jgi:hypothetical protein
MVIWMRDIVKKDREHETCVASDGLTEYVMLIGDDARSI